MKAIKIIPCQAEDWKTLQELSIQTFKDTYENQNDPEQFRLHLQKAFNQQQLIKELQNSECAFYFIKKEKQTVGYIKLNVGAAQTENLGPDYLELERIYVLRGNQGLGLGRRLIEKSIEVTQAKGKQKLWLGVWEKNTNAIAFYKRLGFEIFDTHIFKLGEDEQKDFMMELAV